MIGLRQTARGIWVHGKVLSYNRISAMAGSCHANGGSLAFGPIGSGPMYGFWCCGQWGCTEAWRPDTGRGVLSGTGVVPSAAQPLTNLGQWKSPFQTGIEDITRALNSAPCIPSRGWVPIIDKAVSFASEQTPYPFSFFRLAPGNAIAIGRGDMAKARATLDYWRRRLSTEPEQAYCKGYNLNIATKAKTNSQDRWLITQAVMAPYVAASGIAGAKEVIGQATVDLAKDISTLAPLWRKDYKDEMPWYARLDYLLPIAAASVMAGLFFRVKGSAPLISQPKAEPEPDKSVPDDAPPKHVVSAPLKHQSIRRTSDSTMSRPPRISLSGNSAREWAEYKKLLRSGEPRNRRHRVRHNMEAA